MQKSPLRYPGGKSRAIHLLEQHLPKNITSICSPFFGGGSFELHCLQNNITIYGYDYYKPLVSFWNQLQSNSLDLYTSILTYFPLSKQKFLFLQKELNFNKNLTEKEEAVYFFVLNRSSFSGTTNSGGMSINHPRFNINSINKVKDFSLTKFSIQHETFEYSIQNHPNDFLFLDPPYLIKNNLYGNNGDLHKSFNHNKLFEILNNRKNWLLCYNDSPEIRQLYSRFLIHEVQWSYGMSSNKQSKELIITAI